MRRSVLAWTLVWVGVVAAASALTWAVISTAGQQALSGSDAPTPAAVPVSPSSPASPTTGTSPPASPEPAGSPSPTYVERVWRGAAGTVVARCTGERLDLRSATPNDEYHVEVETSGGGELEVTFESETDEVKVTGTCVDGVPRFEAESRSEDED